MERRSASVARCLGQPAHPMSEGDILCPTCHCFRAQTIIGRYLVLRRLGRGRSGDAYLVQHTQLQQFATLKLFPADRASRPLWDAARREIRAVTALRHAALLPIFQSTVWNQGTTPQLPGNPISDNPPAQEYLLTLCQFAPLSLTQVMEKGQQMLPTAIQQMLTPDPYSWTLSLIAAIGEGLSIVHSSGIAHGALSPGNILAAPGQFWLADFGLASLHPLQPPYLAPELEQTVYTAYQDQNFAPFWRARSAAGDQYALAVIYRGLLATTLPRTIADRIAPILQKAMHSNPTRRFANIQQMTQALLERLTSTRLPLSGKQETTNPGAQSSASLLVKPEESWEERGNSAFRAHRYEQAVQAYEQAVVLSPQKAALWAALGDSFFALNQNLEAVDAYGKALRLNPTSAEIWMNRGIALEQLGRSQEAQACYERASQLREP